MKLWRSCTALLLAVFALTALTGCERVTPVRTLPAWVRGVYVPMIKNKSYEPGLEEQATRLIQEQFLFDGRLDVVPKNQADMIVVVEIINYRGSSAGSSGDQVVTDEMVQLTAHVSLFEPYNMATPIAVLPPIEVLRRFNIDTRSVDFEPEPDRKRELMERLALSVVNSTITGFPVQLGTTPVGTALPSFVPGTPTAAPPAATPTLPDNSNNSSIGAQ